MKPAVFTGHSLDPQVSGERMYTAQVMLQHTPAGPVRKLSIERRNGQDGIPWRERDAGTLTPGQRPEEPPPAPARQRCEFFHCGSTTPDQP